MKSQVFKVRLHVLTPIHIGCDDVYEPTGFVIDEKKKKLIEFDPIEFIESLSSQEREEIIKTIFSNNLLDIFKTIKHFYKPTIRGREVEITDHLVEHYKKVLAMSTYEKKIVINQFTINRTAYNPHTSQPYIPGSSIKGAIRTAYLNMLAKEKKITNFQGKSDELESRLLDRDEGKLKMTTDPFRMLKVSDFLPVGDVKTKILYAINRKKEKSDKPTLAERGGVYQILEVIKPGAVFEGTINLNSPFDSSRIKSPIIVEKLKKCLNNFYVPLLENEIKTLKGINIFVPLINEINSKFKGQINKSAFIISIGRHSGAEAVTIEGNRRIKIMQGRGTSPKYLDHATTIWLASDKPKPQNNNALLPFSWGVLEIVNTC